MYKQLPSNISPASQKLSRKSCINSGVKSTISKKPDTQSTTIHSNQSNQSNKNEVSRNLALRSPSSR